MKPELKITHRIRIIYYWLLMIPMVFSQNPELVVQTGHIGEINTVAFSPDGKFLGSAGRDGTVKLWDIRTGKEIRTVAGHFPDASALAFSPARSILAAAGTDILLWDYTTGEVLDTIAGHWLAVETLAFSPDGSLLVSAGRDSLVLLWNLARGNLQAEIQCHTEYLSAVFTPGGDGLAIGEANGQVRFWDIAAQQEIGAVQASLDEINPMMTFSPDGNLLASIGEAVAKQDDFGFEYPVMIWDFTGNGRHRQLIGHTEPVWAIVFHPDSQWLASADSQGEIKLWDLSSGTVRHTYHGHQSLVRSLAFSPDGNTFVSAGADRMIKLWRVDAEKEFRSLSGHAARLNAVAFRPDGKIIALGRADHYISLWDLESGIGVQQLLGHTAPVTAIAFSPDGELLASASEDTTVKLWEVESQRIRQTLTGHKDYINALAFSPDGMWLASAGGLPPNMYPEKENDAAIRIWEVRTGRLVNTLSGHRSEVLALAFHPHGNVLASAGSDSSIILWDVPAGKVKSTLRIHSDIVYDVVFNPEGSLLASSSWDSERGGIIKLLQTRTGKVLSTLLGLQQPAGALAFMPDGQILMSGDHAEGIKFWEVETGRVIDSISGPEAISLDFALSPDGRYLASFSMDAALRLWDLSSKAEIVRLILSGQNEHILATAENYYYATRKAYPAVAFRLGAKAFPFEQFDLRLNRPDLVLKKLGLASPERIEAFHRAYRKRLYRLGFSEEELNETFHLPEIEILSANLPVSMPERSLKFRIRAGDSQNFLDRLKIYMNDVPVYGDAGIDLKGRRTLSYTEELNLVLLPGQNKIQVSVLNDQGVESLWETFEVTCTAPAATADLYVAAIGVSHYRDKRYNLTYAAKDADDIASLFAAQRGRFDRIHVFRILNADASKEKILALKDALMQSRVDDEVILFVAGHGLLDQHFDYYFASSDINFEHPSERGLPYDAIEGLLDGIPARKKLLLMDTCHSGEVDKEETMLLASADTTVDSVTSRSFRNVAPILQTGKLGLSNSFQLMQELFANLSRGSGAMVISAASGVEFAYEDQQWQNGVFTYCVLEGLKTLHADLNKDGEIRVSELKEYVTEKVQKLTQGRQTPTSRRENLEFDFRVY